MYIKINKIGKQEVGIWWVQKWFLRYGVPIWSLWPNIRFLPSIFAEKKWDEKCAYMFNVYKNQQSRQTGNRNLTGPKTLPTIWYTYMTLVTKYQIFAINRYWEKCDEKYLGWTEGRMDGRKGGQTARGKTVYPLREAGVLKRNSACWIKKMHFNLLKCKLCIHVICTCIVVIWQPIFIL
jgi:hypothetical protein